MKYHDVDRVVDEFEGAGHFTTEEALSTFEELIEKPSTRQMAQRLLRDERIELQEKRRIAGIGKYAHGNFFNIWRVL